MTACPAAWELLQGRADLAQFWVLRALGLAQPGFGFAAAAVQDVKPEWNSRLDCEKEDLWSLMTMSTTVVP